MDGTRHEVAKVISISTVLFGGTLALCIGILGADPSDKVLSWAYSFPSGQATPTACARLQRDAVAARDARQPSSYVLMQGWQRCQTLLAGDTPTQTAAGPP